MGFMAPRGCTESWRCFFFEEEVRVNVLLICRFALEEKRSRLGIGMLRIRRSLRETYPVLISDDFDTADNGPSNFFRWRGQRAGLGRERTEGEDGGRGGAFVPNYRMTSFIIRSLRLLDACCWKIQRNY